MATLEERFAKLQADAQGEVPLEDRLAKLKADAEQPDRGLGEDVRRGALTAASGALAGFGDEIYGGVGALTEAARDVVGAGKYERPIGDVYSGYRDQARQEMGQFSEENPVTAFGLELGGGLATAGPATVGALGSQVLKNAPTLARIAAPVFLGAGEGGLAGAGYSEGETVGEVAADTGIGAALGGSIGAAAPVAAKLVGKAVSGVAHGVGDRFIPKTAAQRKIMQTLVDQGMTPQQAAARMAKLGPEGMLADVVPGLADDAANSSRKVMNRAQSTLAKRAYTMSDRISDSVDSLLTDVGYYSSKVSGKVARAQAAKKAYTEAYAAKPLLESGEIKTLLKSPRIMKAIKKAREHPKWTDLPDNSIELVDAAYKEIGKRVRMGKAGHSETELFRELRSAMMEENPAYRKAVEQFADESAVLDAMDAGKKLFYTHPDELRGVFTSLTKAEKDAFRIGAADAMKDKIISAKDSADVVKRVFGSRKSRAQLRTVFPTQKAFREFEKRALRESVMSRTNQAVRGNSKTALREAGKVDLVSDVGGAAADAAQGRPMSAVGKMVGGALRSLSTPENIAEELGPHIFNKDQTANAALLRALTDRSAQTAARSGAIDDLGRALLGVGAMRAGKTGY